MTKEDFDKHLGRLGVDKWHLGGLIGVQVVVEYTGDTARGGKLTGTSGLTVYFFDFRRQAKMPSLADAARCVESLPTKCGLKSFWEAIEKHGGEIGPLTESLVPRPQRTETFET